MSLFKEGTNTTVYTFQTYLQVACGYVAARVVVILPQTYLPLYLIDTLKMDRVGSNNYVMYVECTLYLYIVVIGVLTLTCNGSACSGAITYLTL